MIDLEAIRARNETRKRGNCYDCGHAHNDSDARADIDALIAEVERLRHKSCECVCDFHIFPVGISETRDYLPGNVCEYMRRLSA